jgi:hypothetical protein
MALLPKCGCNKTSCKLERRPRELNMCTEWKDWGKRGGQGKVGPEEQIIIIEAVAATPSFNQRIHEARVQPKERSQRLGNTQTCQNPSFICQFQALIKILSLQTQPIHDILLVCRFLLKLNSCSIKNWDLLTISPPYLTHNILWGKHKWSHDPNKNPFEREIECMVYTLG